MRDRSIQPAAVHGQGGRTPSTPAYLADLQRTLGAVAMPSCSRILTERTANRPVTKPVYTSPTVSEVQIGAMDLDTENRLASLLLEEARDYS